jgi:hypothetical protein
MNATADSKTTFKFLDAKLFVKRIRPHPDLLSAHNDTLTDGAIARYNLTRVELKSFTFAPGSNSLSINNLVLGPITKRILFTMVKNTDILGSMATNPFDFHHYDLDSFVLYVNGKHPSEGLSLGMDHEKTSVMGYRTLFEGSGIHHSNAGLQITRDNNIVGYFMLLFDFTPDLSASEGNTSHMDSGNIMLEFKFRKALPDSITCLLYLEYNISIRVESFRNVSTDF